MSQPRNASIHRAARLHRIEPFYVMALLSRARALEAQGQDIVHMEIGEPDFPTPEPVIKAGQEALVRHHTHYTPALGLAELREAIAASYQSRYGVAVPGERIVVTPGASGALLLALGALLDPGERMLMADPGYPCNRHLVHVLEGDPIGIPVDAESAYQLDFDRVERAWRENTRGVLIASPSNPTGTLIPKEALAAIAAFVEAHGGALISDEIYHGLTYGAKAETALAFTDEAFVVNSFSKYFGMTGWRLGWLVAPEAYIPDIEKLSQNLFIAPSTPAQHAALAAFTDETQAILEERRQIFQARRDFLVGALRSLGIRIPVVPQGAFYLYADVSPFTRDSYRFAMDLLEKAGVAVTPGRDFGFHLAHRHVRFAYTTSLERLEEGVERLRAFLA
ncbi:MAG: pyridoxal phosphate-dependent aminotransferase [Gammaproteobacteria bacterium]|nr:MAG: pyridoxal phosphate-dependent aminotransferase [Gammaproteobacteria bacterium]